MSAEVIQQYHDATHLVYELEGKMMNIFIGLPSIKEKLVFVLENGIEFLNEEGCYCPHVMCKGYEVSLRDHLHWERYETKDVEGLLEHLCDSLDHIDIDWDETPDVDDALLKHIDAVVEKETPILAIIKDMLDCGIGRATFDW